MERVVQRGAVEALQPRPQRLERRPRLLRLQAADPLDRRDRVELRALEQQLPRERRPVERLDRDVAGHAGGQRTRKYVRVRSPPLLTVSR